jgi:WD40 repeat protein
MVYHVGQTFGNYRLIQLLGGGGFADVYLGEHRYLHSYAALKVLRASLSKKEAEVFLAEAQTLVRLKHPNIVRVLEYSVEQRTPVLVMDYAQNGTIRELHPRGTSVSLATTVSYVKQVAAALQYAHDHNIIHRDVKPGNLLLDADHHLLLSDFGLALFSPSSQQLSTQEMAGTVPYMAPEQLRGKPCFASDQYALGIVTYELLCGKRPFEGDFWQIITQHQQATPPSPRETRPDLPAGIDAVIAQVLAKDPKRRFGCVQAFADALEQVYLSSSIAQKKQAILSPAMLEKHSGATWIQAQPPVSEASGPAHAEERFVPHLSRRAMIAGLTGLVLVGGGVGDVLFWRQPSRLFASSGATSSKSIHSVLPTPTPTQPPIGTLVFTYRRHTDYIYTVQWSSDDKRIVSASQDKTVQVWNALDGGNFLIYKGHTMRANEAVWSPGDSLIASAASDPSVQIWRSTNGSRIYTYTGHTAEVYTAKWSPDGKRIASGGLDETVQIWNASDGGNLYTYKGHSSTVNKVSWSPDGKRIASASADQTVQVWDAVDGANAYIYRGHTASVNMVAWSPDGQRIVSVGGDNTVHVWNASDGGNIFIYTGHKAPVNAAAWSPDGKRIASASIDKTVQIWDSSDGTNIFTYTGHRGGVFGVAWSHDGKYIASSGDNQDLTVQVWQAG